MGSDGGHCSFVLLAEFDILAGAQLKYQFLSPWGVLAILPSILFLQFLALDTPEVKTKPLFGRTSYRRQGQTRALVCLNLVRTKHDPDLNRCPVLLMATRRLFLRTRSGLSGPPLRCGHSMDRSGAPVLTRNGENGSCVPRNGRTSFRKSSPILRRLGTTATTRRSPAPINPFGRIVLEFRGGARRNECVGPAADGAFVSIRGVLLPRRERVWVGDESGEGEDEEDSIISFVGTAVTESNRRRRSTDASSGSSQAHLKDGTLRPMQTPSYYDPNLRSGMAKDTHFYHTTVVYKDHQLPIKMPLATFPEEVGEYSLITLIKAFSSQALVSGPQHPHLHTNGPQTHPIIILFNALVTGKRIIFLGYRKPAGEVSSFVLSACALGSGCGVRAFPYANLNNRDEWEAVPAFIAGVTNPIFKSSPTWDLLLDISTGSVTVARDIHSTYPVSAGMPLGLGVPNMVRTATFNTEASLGSEEDIVRSANAKDGAKADFAKADNNADNIFIEDIKSAIEYHYGESLVRLRFTEYVLRFVRLASRFEEDTTGTTKFGYPSHAYDGRAPNPRLGSGIVFNDESVGRKELAANSHRIEAWRKTNSYEYICADFRKAHLGFDMSHQLFRMRNAKTLSDPEVSAIMRTLVENVKTYDQVVELLAYLMFHGGGLLHLAFCLFHQKESVRDATVDLFDQLRAFPVGVLFLQALNHFQRYAYVRQAHAREKRFAEQYQQQPPPPQQQSQTQSVYGPSSFNRTYSTDRMITPTMNGGF
ncbi:stabilization of polarity axis-domain-containing protein [Mycena olivaceomarginata]|nr:stabilization of polarity axis-domain-containing protein [Mycena olivaceomarginata]